MDKRKHKRSRRFLSALMVLAMLVSLMPAGAFAMDGQSSTPTDIVEDTGNTRDPATEPTTPTEPEEPETPAGDDGSITGGTRDATNTDAQLNASGVTIVKESASNTTYNIGDGQVVMIANQGEGVEPITFTKCTFILSGKTVKISGGQDGISYNNGETITKLFISGAVNFENCRFVTEADAGRSDTAGYDAAIYFYSGAINLNECTLEAEGYDGQFLGLYGSEGAVTFKDSHISTVGNKNGLWSYAMYASSVLKLYHSTMTATGMIKGGSNINAFYSGDYQKVNYDAVFIENGSVIDFSDNEGGGFALNNINIHVKDSTINVNDNLGSASNSGYWYVEDSSITMNGNKGGHALSCNGFEMTDSSLEILHNGYAGVYIHTDSSLTNCDVDIRCNGEKMLSYSAGDVWLNGHTLTVNGGTSDALEGSPWLGAVGRTGAVKTKDTSIVAYDLNSNAIDNLKSNTKPVLTEATLALNGEGNKHTLLLNPFMESAYARGNGENNHSDNDADLFEDQEIIDTENYSEILGKGKAKIGTLTDAQLSHHKYDWNAGKVEYQATEGAYGAWEYPCTDVCENYIGDDYTTPHPYGCDCEGTYVYAPLVGLGFDANADGDKVEGMPANQTTISYEGKGTEPVQTPVRTSSDLDKKYVFTGWYKDAACTEPFDFTQALTENWTVAYAGWKEVDDNEITITPADITIYTGGDSYEGVVGDLEDAFDEAGTSDGLPEPGYYITLPDWLNDLVKINDESEGVETGASDLSQYGMTFTYYGQDGDQIVTRNWPLKLYSEVTGGTSYQTDVTIDGVTRDRYIYQLEPSGDDHVRVQFRPLDADGNVIEGSDPILEDDLFGFDLDNLYERYDMTIYPGFLKQQDVKAQITVKGTTYTLPVIVDNGVLTIRGASEEATNVPISNNPDAIQPVENTATGVTTAIVAPSETDYYINDHNTGSMVSVDPANVRLMTDTLATSDSETGNETEAQTILKDYIVSDMGIASADANYQYQYMDLVDTSNGNAWVTATESIDIYWKLPDGTNAEDYDFQIVHFQGLDREYDDVNTELEANPPVVYSEANKNLTVETIGNDQYLKFSTQTFSPFVLVWDESNGGGGWIPGGGGDPDTPDLNTEDHFSYIVGYPEDYRTGEATDDESLWPVKPQGNITRAEVATIFYRLLTDEARTANWTRDNDYTDVAADSWYNTPVSTLSAMGIVAGYEDGSFRPDAPITRAEFAAIAVRFFENDNVNYEEGLFTDITGSEWFADAVAAAQEHGIVGGYPDGSFQPNKAITRAEATSIVNRTVDRIPDKDHLLPDDQMRVWPDNANTDAWYYADMQEATSGHDYEWILDDNDEPLCEQWTGDLPEVDWEQVEIDQEEKHGLR